MSASTECPEWCISDHPARGDQAAGRIPIHESSVLFEVPTADGHVQATLERIDGIGDGSGGLRVNFDAFDVAVDDLPQLVANLRRLADVLDHDDAPAVAALLLEPGADAMTDSALITVGQAAAMLGAKPWPVYRLLESREIPSTYIGSRRLVRPEDVRAYAARAVEV